ncbi:family 1 glycosylhydrolase [Escherichia coli]
MAPGVTASWWSFSAATPEPALAEAFDGLVKYWLTFNEINIMLHSPFSGAGLVFEEGENQDQVKYQAAHHQLVASALATKIAHEVNPQNQVGCMLAGGNFYPYSCKPEDVWAALEKDRENLFFIDVQARGAYPAYSARVFREKGVTINKAPGDDEILKNTVDFVSFSYYASRCASAEMNANNSSAANVVKSLRNPYLQVSDWGWGIGSTRSAYHHEYDVRSLSEAAVSGGKRPRRKR